MKKRLAGNHLYTATSRLKVRDRLSVVRVSMTRYFLISASADHVAKGKELGIAQAGHGKKKLINRLSRGDWLVYYSAKETMEGEEKLKYNNTYLVNLLSVVKGVTIEQFYQNHKIKTVRELTDYDNSTLPKFLTQCIIAI